MPALPKRGGNSSWHTWHDSRPFGYRYRFGFLTVGCSGAARQAGHHHLPARPGVVGGAHPAVRNSSSPLAVALAK
jgi:hypothetical protein